MVGVPSLSLTFVIYTTTFLAIGFYAAATAPNIARANVTYGKCFGFYIIGITVVGMLLLMAVTATGGKASPLKYLFAVILPPGSMVSLGFANLAKTEDIPWWIGSYVVGLVFAALGGFWIWRRTLRKFVAACSSTEERGPLLDNRDTTTS